MKRKLRRKRKAVRDEMEGEGSSGSTLGLDKETSSRRASYGDRLRGEERSKRRGDHARRQRAGREQGGKGKGITLEMRMGEYSVRHRYAFESICTLIEELSEVQNKVVRGIMWGLVLNYKWFVMDRRMVKALIHVWNPDTKAFRIGRREV